jgi:hypothetical protein
VVSKNVKNFTAQNAVRKMFFEEKFLKLIKEFFVQKMQTTRQQFAILKFEWAAINFQLLQTGLFNQCETTVFRKIIALLSIAVDFAYNKSNQ